MNFFVVTRNLYSSNISFRERDTAALYENGMALNIDYEQLLEAQKNVNVLIVDVREPSEIQETGKLPGSIHIPSKNLIVTINFGKFTVHFPNVIQ